MQSEHSVPSSCPQLQSVFVPNVPEGPQQPDNRCVSPCGRVSNRSSRFRMNCPAPGNGQSTGAVQQVPASINGSGKTRLLPSKSRGVYVTGFATGCRHRQHVNWAETVIDPSPSMTRYSPSSSWETRTECPGKSLRISAGTGVGMKTVGLSPFSRRIRHNGPGAISSIVADTSRTASPIAFAC